MPKRAKKASGARGLETVPSLVMVVDEDLVVHQLNGAARAFLGSGYRKALGRRSGEAFDCTHCQERSRRLRHRPLCQLCPIREAAIEALKHQWVVRRRTKAELGGPAHSREVHLLITATPLPASQPRRLLLVLEDITALMELQDPAPICACCKRVRDDDHYWEQVQVHFRRHFDLDLSHGTCPDCTRQFFGELMGKRSPRQPRSVASV